MRKILLFCLSVCLFAVSMPKFNWFIAAFFFLVPLLMILENQKARRGFATLFLFSFFSYLLILYWIPNVMVYYGGMGRAVSVLGLIILSAFLSTFSGFAGTLIKYFLRKGYAAMLFIPLAWVAKDLVVEHVLGGFPWCLTGYSQLPNSLFIQVAEWGGVHLITFLVVFLNTAIYFFWKQRDKRVLIAIGVCLIGIYSSGFYLKQSALAAIEPLPVHKAGIIQPNAKPEEYLSWPQKKLRLQELFTQSLQLKDKGAEFVVWPEFTVSLYPLQTETIKRQFTEFTAKTVPLIAGFTDLQGHQKIYNSSILFDGDNISKYDKVHLTPFGEYVLFRDYLFFVKRIVDEISDFSPGEEVRNLYVDGHALASPICYEVIFPELVRDFVAKGAELLITISNDSWFGDTSAPYQHLGMAIFRCVENRRYLLRSTTNGVSALVDPTGALLYHSPYNSEDRFIASFKYIRTKTVFTRFGYLFPYFCLGLLLLVLGWQWLAVLRKKRNSN